VAIRTADEREALAMTNKINPTASTRQGARGWTALLAAIERDTEALVARIDARLARLDRRLAAPTVASSIAAKYRAVYDRLQREKATAHD
jgi:hypothetical protein